MNSFLRYAVAALSVAAIASTDAEAVRGRASYKAVCSGCHGNALEGVSAPGLTGDRGESPRPG